VLTKFRAGGIQPLVKPPQLDFNIKKTTPAKGLLDTVPFENATLVNTYALILSEPLTFVNPVMRISGGLP